MSDYERQLGELLDEARAGSAHALGRLLESHRSYLRLLARVQIDRRLSTKVDPSDIVQQTFLDATASFPEFRGGTEAEFAVWLRRILAANLSNVARRYLTQRRDVRLELELETAMDDTARQLDRALIAATTPPDKQLERHERLLKTTAALDELPSHYREVLILRHLEDLSFPEIARRLDRSVDSVKNVWARALAKLKTATRNSGPDDAST